MPFNTWSVPVLGMEHAFPYFAAQQNLGNILGQQLQNQQTGIQNQYLPQSLQASILQQQLANQKQQTLMPFVEPTAQAELLKQQLENKYYGPNIQSEMGARAAAAKEALARAALTSTTNQLQQQTMPYDVAKAQQTLLSDPILNRLAQLQAAQKYGIIPKTALQGAGLIPGTGENAPLQNNAIASQMGGAAGGAPLQQPQIPFAQRSPFQPQAQTTPATAPKAYSGNEAQNWALFGTPYNPLEYKTAEETAATTGKENVREWNKSLDEADEAAKNAQMLQKSINKFSDAYDKSNLKGSALGWIPASAPGSTLLGAGSPEQIADQSALEIMGPFGKQMFDRVTNYDVSNVLQNLKLNRRMDPITKDVVMKSLNSVVDRNLERQKFLTAARDKGISRQLADTLWRQYDNERPLYNPTTREWISDNADTWQNYLSQDAINAVTSGRPFMPNHGEVKKNLMTASSQDLMRRAIGGG